MVGRPVVVLEKTNVVPEHNQYFQVILYIFIAGTLLYSILEAKIQYQATSILFITQNGETYKWFINSLNYKERILTCRKYVAF